jgi:simple sugar transport system substrate-binding protein
MASLIDNWGPYYIARTQAVLDGTWKSEQAWWGLKEDMLRVAPLANMPDDVKAMAEDTMKKIVSGEIQIFKGPITKQDGSAGVPDGTVISDGDLLGMNWYVKGIDDTIPQ